MTTINIENKEEFKQNTKSQNISSEEILQVKLNHDLCQKEFVQLKKETIFQLKQVQFNLTKLEEKIITRINKNDRVESFKSQDRTCNLPLETSWKRAITACRHSIERINSKSFLQHHFVRDNNDHALRHPMLNRPTKPPPRKRYSATRITKAYHCL